MEVFFGNLRFKMVTAAAQHEYGLQLGQASPIKQHWRFSTQALGYILGEKGLLNMPNLDGVIRKPPLRLPHERQEVCACQLLLHSTSFFRTEI